MSAIEREGERLRITIGELDKYQGRPLYEKLVEAARDHGIRGATVLRGMMGFGAHRQIHSPKILSLAENLPIVVEIVDVPENIEGFLSVIEPMLPHQVVSIDKVKLVHFE